MFGTFLAVLIVAEMLTVARLLVLAAGGPRRRGLRAKHRSAERLPKATPRALGARAKSQPAASVVDVHVFVCSRAQTDEGRRLLRPR